MTAVTRARPAALPPGVEVAFFEELVERSPDAVVVADENGRVVWCNDQVLSMLGWDPDDLVGRLVEVLLPHALKARHVEHRRAFRAAPAPRPMGPELTLTAVRADGTELPVEISLTPLRAGGANLVAAVIRDATVRRTAEAALQASEERMRTSLDSMLDGFAAYRCVREQGVVVDFEWTYINAVGATTYRRTPAELVGARLCDVLPQFRDSGFFERYVEVVETGVPWSSAALDYADDDLRGTFELRAWRLGDGFAVTWRDVSAQARVAAAAQASEERLRGVMASFTESLSLFTSLRDDTGEIVDFRWDYANRNASITTGYSSEELVGKTLLEVLPQQGPAGLIALYARVVETGEPYVEPALWYEDVWGDGQKARRCFDVRASKVGDGFVVVTRDVTAEREREAELELRQVDLERSNAEMRVLRELGDLLQSCADADEGYDVVARVAPRLFPDVVGALSSMAASRDDVEVRASWGKPIANERFRPEQCWALRRGQVHRSGPGTPRCAHLPESVSVALCVPMIAQGATSGALHLMCLQEDRTDRLLEELALTTAAQLSLALANLALRDTLRALSVRDPLTGLFNRRYMEETLQRELARAERSLDPLVVLQIDVDHFKRVNDEHGHDVGDVVLRAVSDALRDVFREEDVVCRYGGEEFAVILSRTGPEIARQRYTALREGLAALRIPTRDGVLAAPSVSCGLAVWPEDGGTGADLLLAADQALYAAKAAGRDRLVRAGGLPVPRGG